MLKKAGVAVSVDVSLLTFIMFYLNLVFDPLVYTLHLPSVQSFCTGWFGALMGSQSRVSDGVVSYNHNTGSRAAGSRAEEQRRKRHSEEKFEMRSPVSG